jgi:endoglucanase
MWKFEPGGPLAPRQIETLVRDLVGQERGEQFWREFRDRFITEADVARIAAEGFDHVRLAMNARLLMSDSGELVEEGFALIDRLINWCRTHQLWVVLDLHGAPGGQTGTNIDDSPRGLPELFIAGGSYVEHTIELWRSIAERYRDETVVAAYDLLNEPLPNEYQHRYATDLAALYQRLTAAIREIDTAHVIVYEGTHWSNNWSIFTEVWDPNTMLQCHKYWNAPDKPSVQGYIDQAKRLKLPVYMGETGENNLDWMATAFQLYEDCGMSWNLWPWKKIETVTSPCSIDPPAGWVDVVAFARGLTDDKPEPDRAWAILSELLERLDIARCTYRQDVVNAVMRRAPVRLPAWGFAFGGAGVSYQTSHATPLASFRADDQVTLVCDQAAQGRDPSFHHNHGAPRADEERIVVQLDVCDWVAYDVEVTPASAVRVTLGLGDEMEVAEAPALEVTVDGRAAGRLESRTGVVTATSDGTVGAGRHRVRVAAVGAPILVRWLDVEPIEVRTSG